MKRSLIIAFAVFALFSCSPGEQEREPVMLRIKNAAFIPFSEVQINSNGAEAVFGPLDGGEYSNYLKLPYLYGYALIEIKTQDEVFQLMPTDDVSEEPLAAGRYTYELSLTAGASTAEMGSTTITLRVIKEK